MLDDLVDEAERIDLYVWHEFARWPSRPPAWRTSPHELGQPPRQFGADQREFGHIVERQAAAPRQRVSLADNHDRSVQWQRLDVEAFVVLDLADLRDRNIDIAAQQAMGDS